MAGKTAQHNSSNNSVETDSHSGSTHDVGSTVKNELINESMRELWKQFFDSIDPAERKNSHGEMSSGQEIVFSGKKPTEKPKTQESLRHPDILPGINYRTEIVHGHERAMTLENREITHRLQEVQGEIQRLMSSYKTLEIEFRDVAMTRVTPNVGTYHITFLDFVLAALRSARIKIEDSSAWLGTMKGKYDHKGMAKTHGTSYTQSNERAVATQTG